MKILTVTNDSNNSISRRININFINYLGRYFEKYKCIPLYNPKKLLLSPIELWKKYKPDVIICHEHCNFLDDGFFEKLPCLKIMIAVDFRKIIDKDRLDFYHNNKFDLVFHRHWLSEETKKYIPAPTVWLPWAINKKDFFPIKFESKTNKLIFVGTRMPEDFYDERNKVINKLANNENFINFERIIGKNYPRILNSHSLILHSSEYNAPKSLFGKFFETIASGSIPFTKSFNGWQQLFDEKFWIEYTDKSLEKQLNESLKCTEMLKKYSKIAYQEFRNKHTFEHRIQELVNNIKNLYNGKELERKWEK